MASESKLMELWNAVRVLVDAGVSDATIGRTVRELVSATDQRPPAPRQVDVGLPGIEVDERRVFGPLPPPVSQPTPPAAANPASALSIRSPLIPIKVRFVDGKTTNVVVDAAAVDELAARFGGQDSARAAIRAFAREMPAHESNRSSWVQRRIAETLARNR